MPTYHIEKILIKNISAFCCFFTPLLFVAVTFIVGIDSFSLVAIALAALLSLLSYFFILRYDNYNMSKILFLLYFFLIHPFKIISSGGLYGADIFYSFPFMLICFFIFGFRKTLYLMCFYFLIVPVIFYLNSVQFLNLPIEPISFSRRLSGLIGSSIFTILICLSIRKYLNFYFLEGASTFKKLALDDFKFSKCKLITKEIRLLERRIENVPQKYQKTDEYQKIKSSLEDFKKELYD